MLAWPNGQCPALGSLCGFPNLQPALMMVALHYCYPPCGLVPAGVLPTPGSSVHHRRPPRRHSRLGSRLCKQWKGASTLLRSICSSHPAVGHDGKHTLAPLVCKPRPSLHAIGTAGARRAYHRRRSNNGAGRVERCTLSLLQLLPVPPVAQCCHCRREGPGPVWTGVGAWAAGRTLMLLTRWLPDDARDVAGVSGRACSQPAACSIRA